MKESDLFEPIKAYFETLGYSGDGEVGSIDLYLEKDGLTTAVELKKTLDFRSIQQAALDQKTCDFVYIGISRPRDLYSKSGRDKLYLLKRLGIGLICVSSGTKAVEVISDPVVSELDSFRKRHSGRADEIKAEFRKRRLKTNTGGVSKTGLMTAYREEALRVLAALSSAGGQASTRRLRELTSIPGTTNILYRNYYGWFENVSKGIYRISGSGQKALKEYENALAKLTAQPGEKK